MAGAPATNCFGLADQNQRATNWRPGGGKRQSLSTNELRVAKCVSFAGRSHHEHAEWRQTIY